MKIDIKRFRHEYQNHAKALILSGLKEHWSTLNYDLNTDLDTIASTYAKDLFLTAWHQNTLIGTGAAIFQKNTAQIVRMSVHSNFRRKGIGRRILESLIAKIKNLHISTVLLETTRSWNDVISFYKDFGFEISHYDEDDVYLKLEIH